MVFTTPAECCSHLPLPPPVCAVHLSVDTPSFVGKWVIWIGIEGVAFIFPSDVCTWQAAIWIHKRGTRIIRSERTWRTTGRVVMTEDGSGIGEGIPAVYGIVVLENGTWRRQEGVLGRSFILGGLALLPLSNVERVLVLGMLFTDVFLKPYIF